MDTIYRRCAGLDVHKDTVWACVRVEGEQLIESFGTSSRELLRRRTGKANCWLKAALTQAAWGASRTRRSYFSAQHRRLTTRRGVKRATIAVAHSLLVTAHCLLREPKPYVDLGLSHLENLQNPEKQADRMIRRLPRLGYSVEIKRPAA